MEGNDLGSEFPQHFVVVMDDTLWTLPKKRVLSRNWDKFVERCVLNEKMIGWMVWFSRQNSMPIRIWSFLRPELFDRLIMPIERLAGDFIVEYNQWPSVHEAWLTLRITPDIYCVYDADADRVERYWQFRGARVQEGATP